jgi:hypothetical protein
MLRPEENREGKCGSKDIDMPITTRTVLTWCASSLMSVLLASVAVAQSVGVNGPGCQILAADCATIVRVPQASTLSIVLKNGRYVANCHGILPGDAPAPPDGKSIKCSFANTGQACVIGTSQDVTANCSSTTGNSTSQSTTQVTTSNSSSAAGASISTQSWKEVIQPNGRVSLHCQASQNALSSATQSGE